MKWVTYPADVLPMFVAEMDFPLAPAIRQALHEALERGDSGYVHPHDTAAATAFSDYAADSWGWAPSIERMSPTTDVSVVIVESLRRLISPGDDVVIMSPVYPPFFDLVPEAGGKVRDVPLLHDGDVYGIDLAGVDKALRAGARGVLLCHPQNPVGTIHPRDQLVELANIVDRHDGFVISDEIHAPLTHRGHTFVPYLTVSDKARDHGIAAESGSKAFNLAGFKAAFFVAESERMTGLITSLPRKVATRTGLFGLIATREGFAHSRDWLDATISAIELNFALLGEALRTQLPGVTLSSANAGFLAWLDMSALGWGDDPAERALQHAKVALSSGPSFGPSGVGHVRMNLACAPTTLLAAIDRLAAAVS